MTLGNQKKLTVLFLQNINQKLQKNFFTPKTQISTFEKMRL